MSEHDTDGDDCFCDPVTIKVDPSPSPFPGKIYLSKVPSRWKQEVKLHMNIGHAKAALATATGYSSGAFSNMELWELDNGVWTKLYDVPAGTKRGEMPWQVGK